ncbi:hypothetical protein QZM78_07990 [Burkholderia multivorans]|uniref:hypothetical protein n=1 Tax=Burkholderia multivorans TaxID=87883 RepID=UPI0020B365CA|nr:hypothetical protein [Burkholderia multivorans]MDN7743984.1 hypothetical protein [Burkholderia multivorans]MDN7953188.1 hypothetical protein [Burkholderia multivorans]
MAISVTKAARVLVPPTARTSRMWLDACTEYDDAREMCSDVELLGKASHLERMSAALWGHGDRSCCASAIQAMHIARLIVAQDKPPAVARAVLASELQGAVLDVGDALDRAGRSYCDPVVQQVDVLTELLWSRGDDKHARAAVRLQRIAVTLIQSGVCV